MAIILFDGECTFCNRSVQFIIKRDRKRYFQFALLQGATGEALLRKYKLNNDFNSIVVIDLERHYLKSDAVLKICKHLKRPWNFFSIFRILSPFARDYLYDIIAKNRYRLFGKNDICMLPSLEERKRFLD